MATVTRARREREKQKRRQSILKAARKVFFERGYHQATVDEVAEHAEVSKGTVYLYFQSKEALLAHLLLEGLGILIEDLEQAYAVGESISADERLRRLGRAYLQFFQREPRYFHFLMAMDRGRFRQAVTPEVYRDVLQASMEGFDWVVRAVEQGMQDGLFGCRDAGQAAAVLWATLNGVLELMEHPLRREMVGGKREALYEVALATVVRGMRVSPED